MSKRHTPGKWTYDEQRASIITDRDDGFDVVCGSDASAPWGVINPDDGPLLAASKELLAALEGIISETDTYCPDELASIPYARAAIAKAKGGTP